MNGNNNNHSSNGFGNGFLLGLLIGAAIVFFLGTEKGKKLLKSITENGIEGVSELGDLFEEITEEYEEEDEPIESVSTSDVKTKPQSSSINQKESSQDDVISAIQSPVHAITTTTRRFFKRIPKKT